MFPSFHLISIYKDRIRQLEEKLHKKDADLLNLIRLKDEASDNSMKDQLQLLELTSKTQMEIQMETIERIRAMLMEEM